MKAQYATVFFLDELSICSMFSVDFYLFYSAQVPYVVLKCVFCFPWTQPQLKAFLICVALTCVSSPSVFPVERLQGASQESTRAVLKVQAGPERLSFSPVSAASWASPACFPGSHPSHLGYVCCPACDDPRQRAPSLPPLYRRLRGPAVWGLSGSWRTTRIKYTQPWLVTHQGPDLPLASRLKVGQDLYSKLSMNTTPLIPFFKSDYHDDLGCQVCTLSWLIKKQIQAIIHFLSHFLPVITYLSGS